MNPRWILGVTAMLGCGGKLTHPPATDGGTDVVAYPVVPADAGWDTGTDLARDANPPCTSGLPCTDAIGPCATGATVCDLRGHAVCVATEVPAGTACAAGLCDGHGRCIPPSTQRSCPDPTERGCGMVDIPGATFTLGDSDALRATPLVPGITVQDYRIDAYEVTVARFRRYWASGHPAPSTVTYADATVPFTGAVTPATTTVGCNWTATQGSREAHPINCLDWYTAVAFCVWDGGRLATEAEWEWAARGDAGLGRAPVRSFPWGESPPDVHCDRAQWSECPGDDGAPTRRVGSFPGAAGIYDQAGNVWEWTADLFRTYDDPACWGARPRTNPRCDGPVGFRAIRGGGWYSTEEQFLHGASRDDAYEPSNRSAYVGLRCARGR